MTSFVGTTFYHSTPYSDGLTGGPSSETYYTFALTLPSTSAGDLLFLMASQGAAGEQYFALYPSDPNFGFDSGGGIPREFASRLCDGSESGGTLHWTVKEGLSDPRFIPTYPRLLAIVQYTSLAALTGVGQVWNDAPAGELSPVVFGQVDYEGIATEISWIAVARPRPYEVLGGTGAFTPVVTSYSWANATDRGNDTINAATQTGVNPNYDTEFMYIADVLDDTSMVSGPASPTPAVEYDATFYNPLSGNPSDPFHRTDGGLFDFADIFVPTGGGGGGGGGAGGGPARRVDGYWGVLVN